MKIRGRIIIAVMTVITVLTILYSYYYLDTEREQSLASLNAAIEENENLLKVIMVGPLYSLDIGQLRVNLQSFLKNPDIVYISLTDYDGDLVMVEQQDAADIKGEIIDSNIIISRELDELGELYIRYSTENIERRLVQSRNRIFLFSSLLIAFTSLVIFLIVRGLTVPIENLSRAARKIAQGDLDQNINIEGAGELAILGQSFTIMRDSIKEKIADLADKNTRLSKEINEHQSTQQSLVASENKYRTFFEKSRNPMMLLGRTKFIDGNQALLNKLGLSSVEELRKLTIPEITPTFQPDGSLSIKSITERRNQLTSVGNSHYFETYHQTIDGEIFPVAVSVTVILVDGEPVKQAIWLDISARKKAELEIRQYRNRLEELVRDRTEALSVVNKELEAFSYSVSHDLRAPLRAIDGFSQALIEDYGDQFDDVGKDFLNRVRAGAQHMGELIDSMLQLSRMSRAELLMEQVNLSEIAADIVSGLREEEPGRVVDVSIQPDMITLGDKGLLRILLANFIGNAWKYTGKKKLAKIEFGMNLYDQVPEYFVRDNGAGFDMRYIDKLFGAFQRLHTADEFQGTGIGLATVQRIISRHHGSVRAAGEVGKGATFYFVMGINKMNEQVTDTASLSAEHQLDSAKSQKS